MIFTIIPAKPFNQSKTRLSSVLSPVRRTSLSQILLKQTIAVAQTIGPVAIVSRGRSVRQLAKSLGAWALVENKPDLNAALQQGIDWAMLTGAEAILILPIDLPLLTPSDLQAMILPGKSHDPAMIIAPCRHNQGTNALFLRPPRLIAPQFGPDSFALHLTAARNAGVTPLIYRSPGLALDLDTPADWHILEQTNLSLSLWDKTDRA